MLHAGLIKTRFISAEPAAVGKWLWIACLLIGVMTKSFSQSTAVNLRKNITINTGAMPLDKLLKMVGQQTGARFSLNTRKFPPSRLIRIHQKTQPLATLLEDIRSQTGISYRVLGGHVIFVDTPPAAKPTAVATPEKKTVKKPPVIILKKPVPTPPVATGIDPDTLLIIPEKPVDTVRHIRDTLTAMVISQKKDSLLHRRDTGLLSWPRLSSPEGQKEKKGWGIGGISLGIGRQEQPDTTVKKQEPEPPLTAEAKRTNPAATNPQQKASKLPEKTNVPLTPTNKRSPSATRERFPFLSNWFRRRDRAFVGTKDGNSAQREGLIPFAGIGVSVEESYFVNAQAQAGMPFLYAMASWGTGSNASGLRYGLGSSVRLSDDWRLHLQATTGKMQANYDSAIAIVKEIRMKWHKLALTGERRLNDHFYLQGGISFNMLQSSYYTMGKPAPLTGPEESLPVRIFKPIYTLSNTVSDDGTENTKMWLGAQIGIQYRLHFGRK
ncbi:hypothetical protein [Chitinophaga qingshengii]|uniref:DUF4974 domain-containing protein n=1 Tax=Chitinophaga qingshengii TaxID=1569794 RepID=A0ABR7TXA4_9BACT|nr:hypothetical protein [Chitinophaga qingshengii]MBC9934315.1 hypothetical protein [Chitinophaga qingshengii]